MAGGLVKAARVRDQRGMTTAEYAVGTVATVSFVGIIIAIINNPEFQKAMWEVLAAIIKAVIQAMGVA
ncbi:MAG: DUF4244 domain-containing protein [Actinobacteria bacterium]|nr:DUF4244 domain-containing protein [Actinomycetota bacterium]MCA0434905.1 DUF4244 domain-containing protein [Actinomycetota bacterium]